MQGTEVDVAANTPAQDGWRLLRMSANPQHTLEPGQWLELATDHAAAAIAVYRFHTGEAWWAGLVPPEHRLAGLQAGSRVRIEAIHGNPLPHPDGETVMLGVAEGVGPVLARAEDAEHRPALVLLGDASGLPVRVCPSRFVVPDLPSEVMAGVTPLETVGIAARVAIPGQRPGCYDGDAFELLCHYLTSRKAAGHDAPHRIIAAAPWRLLAPWHTELARHFEAVDCVELPATDGHPH